MPNEDKQGYFDKPPMVQRGIETQQQTANAAEYIAHQLFHIRKALERIADSMEKR